MIKITSEAILAVSLIKLSLTFEFHFSRPETIFFYFFLVFDNRDFFSRSMHVSGSQHGYGTKV